MSNMPPQLSSGTSLFKPLALIALSACVALIGPSIALAGDNEANGTVFGLWEPFAPPENPVTEEKRVLGKILFWDEQLSSDNTMSCGTCHIPSEGGVDPRQGVNPGFDGIFSTADDINGSPGVIATDENDEYVRSDSFDLLPQVTGRRSMTNFVSMYGGNLFWDGRAEGNYVDPLSGEILAMASCALEIQALGPIMSDVEMSHQSRDWASVTTKITNAIPMALATDMPQDMLDAISLNNSYPQLFEKAFGDDEVTPARIGFALATYQRTLIPDQTPWDIWNAGDPDGMTPLQLEGYAAYRVSICSTCHNTPLFADFEFIVDGVRPIFEDLGRGAVTGTPLEDGRFKTGSLRNIGLRDRFMHTGGVETLDDIFDFYGHRNGLAPTPGNRDFRVRNPILFSPTDEVAVKHFILTALVDPRIADETFPFDRPALHTEQAIPNPLVSESGNAGANGYVPEMIAVTPPNIGNLGFKIGLDFGFGGAQAWVAISSSPPVGGVVAQDELVGPITLNGMGPGEGYGTLIYPIDEPAMENETFYMQWIVADKSAADGFARSQVAEVTPFCSMTEPCTTACRADLDGDFLLTFLDVGVFLDGYAAQDPIVDFDDNGAFNFFDVAGFLEAFAAGCP